MKQTTIYITIDVTDILRISMKNIISDEVTHLLFRFTQTISAIHSTFFTFFVLVTPTQSVESKHQNPTERYLEDRKQTSSEEGETSKKSN